MCDKKAERRFILKFIEVYRALPALWDTKSKDYVDRVKKGEQYDVLIEQYREKYPHADKQEVVKKINSLRTNFRKELKRIREAERKSDGTKVVASTLWYFDEMRFLITQHTPTAISHIGTSSDDDHDNNNDDAHEISDSATDDEPCEKNRKRKPIEELVKLATKRLQQPQDDYDKIGAVWAAELRHMAPQQQLFAKKAINDILFEGQMGTLHQNPMEMNAIAKMEL